MNNQNVLFYAGQVLWLITGAMCLLVVSWIIFKVNKRIPASFLINLVLYTVSFIVRNIKYFLKDYDSESDFDIISISICIGIVELSLANFIFQILAFKSYLNSETPHILKKRLTNLTIVKYTVLIILLVTSIAKFLTEFSIFSKEGDKMINLPFN